MLSYADCEERCKAKLSPARDASVHGDAPGGNLPQELLALLRRFRLLPAVRFPGELRGKDGLPSHVLGQFREGKGAVFPMHVHGNIEKGISASSV